MSQIFVRWKKHFISEMAGAHCWGRLAALTQGPGAEGLAGAARVTQREPLTCWNPQHMPSVRGEPRPHTHGLQPPVT